MGKEELLDALAGLQAATSAEGLSDQFLVVHGALSDIERKRWKFLEDSCSVVLRRVFGLVAGAEDEDFGDFDTRPVHITTSEGINLCLKFLEPLIHSTLALVEQLEDEQEAVNQKCVLVAALLYVFAKDPGASEGAGLRSRLVTDVLMCGIDVHVIVATLRFREELVECRRLLLPSYESDSETESELVSDGDDSMLGDMGEFGAEDIQWIVEKVAKVWGLTKYQYFLQTTGQEYAFSAWSYHGIGNFTHELLTVQQQVLSMSLPVVSPLSWMFQISAYAHYMIYSEDHRERLRGLELLQAVVSSCPQEKLLLSLEKRAGSKNAFRDRDWISPVVQVITNAMVSFPDSSDRSTSLTVLKALIFKIDANDRFWLLQDLIFKCPYGNVSAVLVDYVRSDVVRAWSSSNICPQSPLQTKAIPLMLYNILSQAAERDLVLNADLIASCLSLVRFLHIRDKDNITGILTKKGDSSVWLVLERISNRLQVRNEETKSGNNAITGSNPVENDYTHIMILEAALGSTLDLCE